MFSNSSKYAIKAALYLAVNSSEKKKIMIKDIAKPINVPKAYIAKILQELSKKHLVSSAKGPKGGFYLSAENRQVKLMEIIDAVDGEERLQSCLLSLKECNKNQPCSLHHLAYDEKQIIINNFSSTSLDDLSKHIKEGKSILPL